MQKRNLAERERALVASFLAEFPSEAEARQDLTKLGSGQLYQATIHTKGHWYSVARSIYKKHTGEPGSWYGEALPALVSKAWELSSDDANAFVSDIKKVCDALGRQKQGNARRTMSEPEVIEAFRKEFPSIEAARTDLTRLSTAQLRIVASSTKGHWYNLTRRMYKKSDGRQGGWYSEVLTALASKAWNISPENAKTFVLAVRKACDALRRQKQGNARRTMSEPELLEAFRKEFPSIEAARTDLTRLSTAQLRIVASSTKGHWYNVALGLYKKSNGGRGSWYGEILPALASKVWNISPEGAKAFVSDVEKACDALGRRRLADARRTMSEPELLEAFRKEFPSIEAARTDLTRLGSGRLDDAARNTKGHWYNVALGLYKKSNGGRGSWYGEALPVFASKAWGLSKEVVDGFVLEVQLACALTKSEKISQSLKAHPSTSTVKSSRDYAILVATLTIKAKSGASFIGIDSLLGFDSTSATANGNCGIPHAVVSWGGSPRDATTLTPGELVRLKMKTETWGGELAKAYTEAFPFMAPYLATRLHLMHLFGLVSEGKVAPIEIGASFMSGPGEVYGALQDLWPQIESRGLRLPRIFDVDAEPDMLAQSENPDKIHAMLPNTQLDAGSLDLVECSSLYQFNQKKKKYATMARDSIAEAHRVLKVGGTLLLSSLSKRFGPQFEEGLRQMGFVIVTPANTRLKLTPETEAAVNSSLGPIVLEKAIVAASNVYCLVAVKMRGMQDVAPDLFVFEGSKLKLPTEIKGVVGQARRFSEDISRDDSAIRNVEMMARIFDNLSPAAHQSHAVLMQSLLSKYLLDPKIQKPDEKSGLEAITANAEKIAQVANSIPVADVEKDKYFVFLKRMAQTHRAKLNAPPCTIRPILA